MLRGTYRGGAAGVFAALRLARAALAICGALGIALMAAGCTTSGQPALDLTAAGAGIGGGAPGTVAFEGIDGAPDGFSRKLAAQLTQEANARNVVCVSRMQPSQYRVQVYLTAIVENRKTAIAWVWDVSTADHTRVARFTGEATGAPSERAWAAADDAVVARIAQDGMGRLAALLASGPAPVASMSTAGAPLAFLPPAGRGGRRRAVPVCPPSGDRTEGSDDFPKIAAVSGKTHTIAKEIKCHRIQHNPIFCDSLAKNRQENDGLVLP
jgi:hypothetical protein